MGMRMASRRDREAHMGSMEEFIHYANLIIAKRQLADPSIADEQRRIFFPCALQLDFVTYHIGVQGDSFEQVGDEGRSSADAGENVSEDFASPRNPR